MSASTNTSSSMEEAISDAINATVATLVDKAVTRAMEHAFNEAVDKAVEERVHAVSEEFTAAVDRAVKEKVKVFQEDMQKKIDKASRMAELRARIDSALITMSERSELWQKHANTDSHLESMLAGKKCLDDWQIHTWWFELIQLEQEEQKLLQRARMQPSNRP